MSSKTMIIVHYYFLVLYASISALPNPVFQEHTYSTESTFYDFLEEDTTEFEASTQPPVRKSTVVFRADNLSQELPDPSSTSKGKAGKKLTDVDRTKHPETRRESSKPPGNHTVEQTSTDKTLEYIQNELTTSSIYGNATNTSHRATIFDERHAAQEEQNKDVHLEEIRQPGNFYADSTLLHLLVTSLFCLTIVLMLASIGVILYIGISTVDKAHKVRFDKNTGAENTQYNNKFAF